MYVPVHDVVMVEVVTDTELETDAEVGVSIITIGEVVGLPLAPLVTISEVAVTIPLPVQCVVVVDSGVLAITIGEVVSLLSVPEVTIPDVEVTVSLSVQYVVILIYGVSTT